DEEDEQEEEEEEKAEEEEEGGGQMRREQEKDEDVFVAALPFEGRALQPGTRQPASSREAQPPSQVPHAGGGACMRRALHRGEEGGETEEEEEVEQGGGAGEEAGGSCVHARLLPPLLPAPRLFGPWQSTMAPSLWWRHLAHGKAEAEPK
ncbi:unnamed protein product, partial [Prorocentrum cordatum]